MHMKQSWRSQPRVGIRGARVRSNVCQRETLLHLFLRGNGEAKPPPAHTSDWSKIRFQKQKQNKNKLTTNQRLLSQNNRLATHQCPQDSTTNDSALSHSTEGKLGLRDTHDTCALCTQCRYTRTSGTETHEPSLHRPSPQHPNALSVPAKPAQLHASN